MLFRSLFYFSAASVRYYSWFFPLLLSVFRCPWQVMTNERRILFFQNTETPCLSPLKFVCWLLLALSFSFRMLKFCFLIIQIVLDKSRKFIHLRCDNFCWKLYKINAWHRLIITKCNISIELINVENSVENVQNFAPNGYIYYVFYVENLKYADVSTFYT